MYSIQVTAPNRLELSFSGRLDSETMRHLLDEFVEKSASIQHGQILYQIGEFELPSLGAIGVELSRFFELLKVLQRFDRIVLLADKRWLRNAAEAEGALIPGLTIKAFESQERAIAEAWLTAAP